MIDLLAATAAAVLYVVAGAIAIKRTNGNEPPWLSVFWPAAIVIGFVLAGLDDLVADGADD